MNNIDSIVGSVLVIVGYAAMFYAVCQWSVPAAWLMSGIFGVVGGVVLLLHDWPPKGGLLR